MIECLPHPEQTVASPSPGTIPGDRLGTAAGNRPGPEVPRQDQGHGSTEPVLCGHCGRTASNGISCQGICVADSGY